MPPLDSFRHALNEVTAALSAALPPGRERAVLALLHAGDAVPLTGEPAPATRPGWNLALRLCLERPDDHGGILPDAAPAPWAERFLADCDELSRAEGVLARCASGDLHLQERGPQTFTAWATNRHFSAQGRERADFDWWSAHVAGEVAPRFTALRDGGSSTDAGYYRQRGAAYVARFAPQHGYPPDAVIGGVSFAGYTETLVSLIGWLFRDLDRGVRVPLLYDERDLIAACAAAGGTDAATVGRALDAFTLDRDNAAYHATVPGGAAPPLVRLDAGRVMLSVRGLLGEPLLFLARELRRRHAQEYHNAAHLREGMFRGDLYRLFADGRFVRSERRVELKRDGTARTDLDALVFDRKTGTLGVFELKAQDPFPRSVEEGLRRRDNFLHANRQAAAILGWVQRHGADDLLNRFDERAAKRFRVQKVHVFVLGRYVAHFTGGPVPDRRAAWGSWAQVLRAAEDGVLAPDARNPLAALFSRLHDAPLPAAPAEANDQTIAVGGLRVRVYPSFAAVRSGEEGTA